MSRSVNYQDCKYGVSVTNGTRSLEIALRALDIGYGDEVIVPPYTFIATVSSVIMVGATPVFVDLEKDSYNIDADKIEEAITPNTKAVTIVHIGGRPCNMDRIMEIANKHNIHVIEDSAHAHGSEWKGRKVGSFGSAGSFSFQGSKNLCAGEGGCITTNDEVVYEQCWTIHHCGRSFRGTKWYEHPMVGTNARMTEWQAAILNVQMDRLDEQISRRMENAKYLDARLKETGFIGVFPEDERITRNSYHLYIFRFLSEKCKGLSRDVFCEALQAEGVPCLAGYQCLYKQDLLQSHTMKRLTGSKIAYGDLYLENAERADRESVWLLQSLLLGDKKDMDDIVDAMVKIYENAEDLL